MTRFEQLAAIVHKNRQLAAEYEAAHKILDLTLELKRRMEAEIADLQKTLRGLLESQTQLQTLITALCEGEEWCVGDSPLTADNWWHEGADE